jgi:hypothetical protein
VSARVGLVSCRGRRARGRGARLDRGGAERGGALAHQPRHARDALRHSLQVLRRGWRTRRRGRVNGLRRGGRRRGGVRRRGLLHARVRRLHRRRRRLRAVRGLARHLSRARSRLATTGRGRSVNNALLNDSLAFAFAMKSTDEARSSRGGLTHTFHRRAGVRRLTEVRNRDKGVAGWRPQSFGVRRGRATGRSRAFARGVARRRSPTASASRGGFAYHAGRSDTPDWPLQCPFRVGRRRWS